MVYELAMVPDDELPEEDRDLHVQQGDEVRGTVRTYELVEPLGGGGFSVVWSAKPTTGAPGQGSLVAIKFLAPLRSILSSIRLKEMRARNFNEFRALLKVENPRVVRALDAGNHEGVPFIVLEHVEGRTLLDWVDTPNFALTIEWVEALMDELCEAVAALHETRVDDTPIVHRDLKPANVMIVDGGETVGVKVIDLGVAKVGQGLTSGVRKPGFTRDYAATEQALDTDTAMGTWTDVFTLAVMLFDLGAGGPLVKDAKGTEMPWHMFVIGHDDKAVREALASQAAYLPDAVRAVMLRCLRFRTDLRPADARALQRELRAAWDTPKSATERLGRLFGRSSRPRPALANPLTMVRRADPKEQGASPYRDVAAGGQAGQPAAPSGSDDFGRYRDLTVKGVSFRLRWIERGRFLMGSPETEEGRLSDEGPQHEVVLTKGFWMADTPVTQALWEAVMGANPSYFKSPDRPVESVSWDDAETFISRLNELVGEIVFRLPTEAEWEYACRAGTTSATYAGEMKIVGAHNAPALDAIAWYGGNSGVDFDLANGIDSSGWPEKQHDHQRAGTRPVKLKRPNPWGLYDMLGNVWEWVQDFKGSYARGVSEDPVGPSAGPVRVRRGGSWLNCARYVRAAYRSCSPPSFRRFSLGFRLAGGQVESALQSGSAERG